MFKLPILPFAYNALEPFYDKATIKIHYENHHGDYVKKLNTLLKPYPELNTKSPQWLLTNLNKVPEAISVKVKKAAGGHANHSLFWKCLAPKVKLDRETPIFYAIDDAYGSFEDFIEIFSGVALDLYGSGWVWLVKDVNDTLSITTSANHETPLTRGYIPLLVLDMWEHSYYLKHKNKKTDWVKSWFHIVNWAYVNSLYVGK